MNNNDFSYTYSDSWKVVPEFDPNAWNASYGFGCFYKCPNPQYTVPVNDATVYQTAFVYNYTLDKMCLEKVTSKGKLTTIPITLKFKINSAAYIQTIIHVIVNYTIENENYNVIIPYEDFRKGRLYKYFPKIIKEPSCSQAHFNDCIVYFAKKAPEYNLRMFPHQGWNVYENGEIVFSAKPDYDKTLLSMLPESVLRRDYHKITKDTHYVINNFIRIYSSHPNLKILCLWRIASLLLYFFDKENIIPKQLLIVESSHRVNDEKLIAMLNTSNTKPINLECSEKRLLHELNMVYDGVAVFTDNSLLDETKKIEPDIRKLIKAVHKNLNGAEVGRNLIAVISDNAKYVVNKLSPENGIYLSMKGIELEYDTAQIKTVSDEMETFVITTICNQVNEYANFINNQISHLQQKMHKDYPSEYVNIFLIISIAEVFLGEFLGISIFKVNEMKQFMDSLINMRNHVYDTDKVIINRFSVILSDKIRNGNCGIAKKHQNMRVDIDKPLIIVSGDRTLISQKLFAECVSDMREIINDSQSLIMALEQAEILYATDGKTHPIELHDLSGKPKRLYMYDISNEILDSDIIDKLNNMDGEPYFLLEDEIPLRDFLPIITDSSGRVAGRTIRYQDVENGSVYITGQSGYGKSFAMTQLIAGCFDLKHKVIILDSSNSFTEEALNQNLSPSFVKHFVDIYDIDRNGIPIDLLYINRNDSLPTQKKCLFNIITAGIGNVTASQANALRTAISEMLSQKNTYKNICPDDILSMLNNENTASESLINRIQPLFEDIKEYGMSDVSWKEFLNNSKGILLLRASSTYGTNRDDLIDMLIATLYSYQQENPYKPLDMFIDEIQNQNFSKSGPICRVLKEGRKIHMSFYGATQDYYPRNTELGSVMSKADTQIILKPTLNSQVIVAAELRFDKNDMSRFDQMQRGNAIIKGNMYNKELKRNTPVIITGKVHKHTTIPKNYVGNVLPI